LSISTALPPHTHANLSSAAGGAYEFQGGADSQRLLAHQLESEVARMCCVWVEATPVVGYQQRQFGGTNLEHEVYVCGLGVFGNILQRFPSNSGQRRLGARRKIRFSRE
jgi:hypothetical protein